MIDAPPLPTSRPGAAVRDPAVGPAARRRLLAAVVAGLAGAVVTTSALVAAIGDGFDRPLVGAALAAALVAANLAPVLSVSGGRIEALTPVGALLVPIGLLLPLPEAVVVYAVGETAGILAAHRWDRTVGGPRDDGAPRTAFVAGKSVVGATVGLLALGWTARRGDGVPFQLLAAVAGVGVSTAVDRVTLAGVTAWVRRVPFGPELRRGAGELTLVASGEVVAGALIAVLATRDPWSLLLGLAMLGLLLVASTGYARAAAGRADTGELLRLAEELQQAVSVDEVEATLLRSVRRLLPHDDVRITASLPDRDHRGWRLTVPGRPDRWLTTPRLVDTRDYDAQPLVVVEAAVSLAHVALTRAAAQELLVQQDELRALVLSTVAHDLRTPLAIALGSLSTLREHPQRFGEEQRAELLGSSERAVDRMRRLLDDLLGLEAADEAVDPGRADVVQVLQALVDELDLRTVSVEVDLRPGEVAVGAVSLERIVENLLLNAAKFSPAGATVRLRSRQADGGTVVSVADEGPGVAVADRHRIFQPFERAGHRGAGVGLGLYVARRFTERHGGRITVGEAPGGGAEFSVWLPSAPA